MTQHRKLWMMALCVAAITLGKAHGEDTLTQLVDAQIEAGFEQWNVGPAELCSDAEFLRRVSLDLTGRIPTASAVRDFLNDDSAGKRGKLIDQLLESDAYAQHMAAVFDVMLMERRPDKYVETPAWRSYLADSFAANKPLDHLAQEILGADGVDESLRPAAKFYLDRAVDKDTLVRDIGRLFLGVDMQCAQCHDHPSIGDYLHEHYYGLSVFVAGSKTFKQPDGVMVLQEVVMREVEFASVFDPDTTRKTGPRLIDALMELPDLVEGEEYVEKPSRTVRAIPKFSLRALLAEKLPSEETPEFARNLANRLWSHLMGRGLVEPLDMHHSDNPPSHPELLDQLTARLTAMQFNTKQFLRELALSDTYQRSSMAPEGIDPADVPPESFAVANMKGLSPEQLFASLLSATGSEPLFASQLKTAVEEDEAIDQSELSDEELSAAIAEKRSERLKEFVTMFGKGPGQPEGDFEASLPHALFFANSETVISWISPAEENLTQRMAAIEETPDLIEEAYINILSRQPSPEETAAAKELLNSPDLERPTAIGELVWSLIASAEFRLNY